MKSDKPLGGGGGGSGSFIDKLSNLVFNAYMGFSVLYLLANLMVNFLPYVLGKDLDSTPVFGVSPGNVWGWLYYVFGALALILSYASFCLGYYIMGKRRGYPRPWVAWIPFARGFLVADLVGGNLLGIGHVGAVLCWTPVLILFLSLFPVALPTTAEIAAANFLVWPITILGVFFLIYRYAVLYKLYRIYRYSEFEAAVGVFIELMPYINIFYALYVSYARYRSPDEKLLNPPDWHFRP